MDKLDVLDRLREELNVPHLTLKLADKTYSEEDYQKVKKDLVDYYNNYVDYEN